MGKASNLTSLSKKLSKGHKLKGNKRSLRKIVPVADKKLWRLSGRLGQHVNLGYRMQSSRKRKVPSQNMRSKKRKKEIYKYHQAHLCVLLWPFAEKISRNLFRTWLLQLEHWFTSGSFGHSQYWTRWQSSLSSCFLTRKGAAWPHGAAVCFRCMKSTKLNT